MRSFLKKLISTKANIKENISLYHREHERLLNQSRFQEGSSSLWGIDMNYVDACTFLGGGEEIFIKNVYQFNSNNLEPFIIDCGANIGLSVLYFKKIYPNSKIIAFEPDPIIFNVLKENIEKNNIKDVELIQKAIWINNNGVEFNLEGGFSGRIPKSEDEKNIVKVKKPISKGINRQTC